MKASFLLSLTLLISISTQAQKEVALPHAQEVAILVQKWTESRLNGNCFQMIAAANLLMSKNPTSLDALFNPGKACAKNGIDEACLKAADGALKVYLKDQKGYKALRLACEVDSEIRINDAFMKIYGEDVWTKGDKIESPPVADDVKQEKIYDAGIVCRFKKMKLEKFNGKDTCVEDFNCPNVKKFKFGNVELKSGTHKLRCSAKGTPASCDEVSLSSCDPVSPIASGGAAEAPAANSGR